MLSMYYLIINKHSTKGIYRMKKENLRKLKKIYFHFAYIANNIFLPPAKIVFAIWIIYCTKSLFKDAEITFIQKMIILLFGCGFFCGMADFAYIVDKKRYSNYRIRILNKKIKRLKALAYETDSKQYQLQYGFDETVQDALIQRSFLSKLFRKKPSEVQRAQARLEMINQLAETVNTTYNFEEFFQSYDMLIKNLQFLQSIENLGFFTETKPSNDLAEIREKRPLTEKEFIDRYLYQCGKESLASKKIYFSRFSAEAERYVRSILGESAPETKTTSINNFDYMEGHDFEYFCADILKKNGFSNVEVTQGSGDQGIDILATKDGIKYGIQCKCYSSDIGNKAVQEAFSGKTFYNCHVGAVLTNRYFTASAKELAEKSGVLLWNRDKLNELCGVIQNESEKNVIYHKEKAEKSIPKDIINVSKEDSKVIFEYLKSKSLHYIESYLKIKESNDYQNEEKCNVKPPIILYNAQVHFKLNTIEYVFYSNVNPKFYTTSAYRNVHKSKNVDIFQIDVFYDLDSISYDGGNIIISSEPEVSVLGSEFETMKLLEEIDDQKAEEDYLTEQLFYLKKSNYKSV